MNEFAKVCITIQMQNDFESAETCITTTMIRTYANALQGELRKPGKDLIGKTILDQVTAMARANAALMGYELTSVATASILD
nr:MAG TPA: hypothetical protein [Caudoviricetes sp.]DAT81605.1 MAG TPA: hypothetical protein [Caudoviricetes sp.]